MGTFNVTNSTLNSGYNYTDENIMVNGVYEKDAKNNTLRSISGTCYYKTQDGQQGEVVGNFNGYPRDGKVKYSLSEMTHSDSDIVWNAIDGIEPHVLPQANVEGGEA